jgi:predicted metal-binding membrane protein
MNVFTVVAIQNVSLIILAGVGMYVTGSCWALLALCAVVGTKHSDDDKKGDDDSEC